MSSAPGKNYLNEKSGLWSWLTTLDHKRIGILYMISVMVFFLIGGIFAMLLRLELFSVGKNIMDARIYNQVMTFHGAIMVFMVIIPGIPAFLGNFILPMQLGAKDVAFPRVNLMSWYCLLTGASIAFYSLFYHGADTGWTFYTPYSISTQNGTILMS
jgi:cytochrome c oxidase subunit I